MPLPNKIPALNWSKTSANQDVNMNSYSITDLLSLNNLHFATKYTDLATAVSTIGATETTLVIEDSEAITDDLTIPATMQLFFLRGGEISVANTKTLTINGLLEAGAFRIFSGAGSVAFGDHAAAVVYSHWWYDGGGDWADAFNTAFTYSDRVIMLPDHTYEVTEKVTYSASNSTLICHGIIKAKDGSDFGSDPVFMLNASDVNVYNLHINGNRANVTDNALTGNQPNLLIVGGSKRLKFIGGTLEQSVYCGVVFNGQTEHVVFDGMQLADIGEHGFYVSGGSNKHTAFRNIGIEDFAQNGTMAADHDTHVFKFRSSAYSTNENITIENIEVSIPSGTGTTTTAVFSATDVDGAKLSNIKAVDVSGGCLFTTDNAKNIELDNFVTSGPVFYNISTGDPNIEGIVLRNSHLTGNQLGTNVCTLVENCIFDGNMLTSTQSANIDPQHSTTFTSCIFSGDTLTSEKLDLAYGLDYPMVFRDCTFSGDVAGSTAIIEVGGAFAGTPTTIKFYNCDFSGCTNVVRMVWTINGVDEFSLIDCTLATAGLISGDNTGILTMIRCKTATTTVGSFTSYHFRDLRGPQVSEASGTATVLAAGTSISVTVGTLIKPVAHEINVHPVESLGNASFWWIVIDAAGFDIHVDGAPGADIDFAWEAKIKQ